MKNVLLLTPAGLLGALLAVVTAMGPLPSLARPPGETAAARNVADDLKREAGQLIIVGFAGTRPGDAGVETVAEALRRGEIGGVIFFDANIVSMRQTRALTAYFRQAAAVSGTTPFLAVDEEGGGVQRLTSAKGFTSEPSASRMVRTRTVDEAHAIYAAMAQELVLAGFNMNLAPVVDLDLNHRNPVISQARRSFGPNPATVEAYAKSFIAAHRQAGVLTVIKHWPGHGSSAGDTHTRIVDVTASFNVTEKQPFERLSQLGYADAIMVGHLTHAGFDGTKALPASLSPKALGVLRREARFSGVTITDDLSMKAISVLMRPPEAAVAAIAAGNDLVLIGDPASAGGHPARATHRALLESASNPAMANQIRKAAARVAQLRQRLR